MKKTVMVAALAASMALPSCTVFHPQRRKVTDWNIELFKEHAISVCRAPEGCDEWNPFARTIIDWLTVQPFAIAMMPISVLTDTLILNPIDAWKCAEMSTHHDRHGRHPEHSDEQAAHYDMQSLPPYVPPNPTSDVLALPRFIGRWLWGSTSSCVDPCSEEKWAEYWNEHKEQTGY